MGFVPGCGWHEAKLAGPVTGTFVYLDTAGKEIETVVTSFAEASLPATLAFKQGQAQTVSWVGAPVASGDRCDHSWCDERRASNHVVFTLQRQGVGLDSPSHQARPPRHRLRRHLDGDVATHRRDDDLRPVKFRTRPRAPRETATPPSSGC